MINIFCLTAPNVADTSSQDSLIYSEKLAPKYRARQLFAAFQVAIFCIAIVCYIFAAFISCSFMVQECCAREHASTLQRIWEADLIGFTLVSDFLICLMLGVVYILKSAAVIKEYVLLVTKFVCVEISRHYLSTLTPPPKAVFDEVNPSFFIITSQPSSIDCLL